MDRDQKNVGQIYSFFPNLLSVIMLYYSKRKKLERWLVLKVNFISYRIAKKIGVKAHIWGII